MDCSVKDEPSENVILPISYENVKQEGISDDQVPTTVNAMDTENSQYQSVKVFKCQVCEYSTNDKSNFKRHQQCKHKSSIIQSYPVKDNDCPVKTETDNISLVDPESTMSVFSGTVESTV